MKIYLYQVGKDSFVYSAQPIGNREPVAMVSTTSGSPERLARMHVRRRYAPDAEVRPFN